MIPEASNFLKEFRRGSLYFFTDPILTSLSSKKKNNCSLHFVLQTILTTTYAIFNADDRTTDFLGWNATGVNAVAEANNNKPERALERFIGCEKQ
jgi:hypothetical protein